MQKKDNDTSKGNESPRSKFGRFFSRKDTKKEKDLISDMKKTYENEWSQTVDGKNIENKRKNDSNESKKNKLLTEAKSEQFISEGSVREKKKLLENELDPIKLTVLINNSIKEAVRSIVKDGVCDFVDSPESTDYISKKLKNKELNKVSDVKEENMKENIKGKSTSEEKKTFDSHCQDLARGRKSPSPYKSPGRTIVDQCERSTCPALNPENIERLKRSKRKKSKHKPHVATDNRRMTGNVNIYICSEANENMKRKSQDREKIINGSESETDPKSSESSASSLSTSKLVNALKKKKQKKLDTRDLECLCEESENIIKDNDNSTRRISQFVDDEIMSSNSKLDNSNDDISNTDFPDSCSLENCPALSMNTRSNYRHSSYDNNSWDPRRKSMKNYSFLPAERDESVGDTFRKCICSCECSKSKREVCCDCESEKQFTNIATNYPEKQESITVCTKNLVEEKEEENQCCICKKKSVELFTVCGRDAISVDNKEEMMEAIKTDSQSIIRVNESIPVEKTEFVQAVKDETIPISHDTAEGSFLLRSWKKAVTLAKKVKTATSPVQLLPNKIIEQQQEDVKNSKSKLIEEEEIKIQQTKNSSSTLNGSQSAKKDKKSNTKIESIISSKRKQNEMPTSQTKILSNENKNYEPKMIPCPSSKPEKKQEITDESCIKCKRKNLNCECGQINELEQYKCSELACKEKEPPTCCTCKRETSCCTCRQVPIFKSPKPCKRVCKFCCTPLDRCTCHAPVRKCSYCGMSSDICNCHEGPLWTEGRPIMIPEKNSGIHVTAWKPRPQIAAYFSRERVDFQRTPDNCYCDKTKPYGSEGLPYQKLNVFSNVMTELQQKISDSVYCNQCNNTPCCCSQIPKHFGKIPERPSSPCRNESLINCKCPRNKRKTTFAICYSCQASPCRCIKDKRPQAKCFYCKTMPCRCDWKDKKISRQSKDTKSAVLRSKRLRGCHCSFPDKKFNKSGDNIPSQRYR